MHLQDIFFFKITPPPPPPQKLNGRPLKENLDIKVTQLKMTVARTDNVIEAGKSEAIERQCLTLKSITAEINRMRLEVEAKKLGAKVDVTDIEAWNAQLDAQLEKADSEVEKVCKWLDKRKNEAEIIAQEEQLKFEEKLQRAKLK